MSCGGSIESWWRAEVEYACAMWEFCSWNEFHGILFLNQCSKYSIFSNIEKPYHVEARSKAVGEQSSNMHARCENYVPGTNFVVFFEKKMFEIFDFFERWENHVMWGLDRKLVASRVRIYMRNVKILFLDRISWYFWKLKSEYSNFWTLRKHDVGAPSNASGS